MHAAGSHPDTPRETAPPAGSPCCPVCNGPLIPLRGAYRCARCFFTLCAACEAGAAVGDGGE